MIRVGFPICLPDYPLYYHTRTSQNPSVGIGNHENENQAFSCYSIQ
jgi:hypothetical protein